jgi:hypothetical protein
VSAHAALVACLTLGAVALVPTGIVAGFLVAGWYASRRNPGALRQLLDEPSPVPLPPLPADVAGQLIYLAPAAERRTPDDRIYLPTISGTRMEIDTEGHVSFHEPEAGQ